MVRVVVLVATVEEDVMGISVVRGAVIMCDGVIQYTTIHDKVARYVVSRGGEGGGAGGGTAEGLKGAAIPTGDRGNRGGREGGGCEMG